ncbi:ParM/StbA family protein [Nostoc sp. FACHB-190]|uniref:ParM/StbA family protein n=1 Tax=Nostoc sp. FACHB-190 TaxID=2692838 RepID=UPI0016877C0F|nr:hypothetical protein [Nostoc sp. FACHB-190]MBD2303035.1 hypothetical protein [Nostoc sp. FACHB-190]
MTKTKTSKIVVNVPKSTQNLVPAKNRKYFRSVVDLGNHWIKAYIEGYELIREPSWYARCLSNTSNKLPGHVKYLSGVRTDLINTCWLVGNQAVRSGSSDLMRLVEDYTGKSSLWLQFFLGTLAHLPQINPQMNLEVTATCNDVKRHYEGIKSNAGTHKVELCGIFCTVNISFKAVLPEGIAALKSYKLNGAVTICDIGGGNTSISRFFDSESVGDVIALDFGAEYLIDKLCHSSDLKALIKQAPNKDIVNRSIEAGIRFKKTEADGKLPFLAYGDSDINFYPVYELELQDFINCRLREVIKQLEQYKLAGDQILIIGGGSKLPLLGAALKSKGFLISDNGAFDNLNGLIQEVV